MEDYKMMTTPETRLEAHDEKVSSRVFCQHQGFAPRRGPPCGEHRHGSRSSACLSVDEYAFIFDACSKWVRLFCYLKVLEADRHI